MSLLFPLSLPARPAHDDHGFTFGDIQINSVKHGLSAKAANQIADFNDVAHKVLRLPRSCARFRLTNSCRNSNVWLYEIRLTMRVFARRMKIDKSRGIVKIHK